MVSLVDLVRTPEGTVVQVQLAFGLMMTVVPQVIPVAVAAGLYDEEGVVGDG